MNSKNRFDGLQFRIMEVLEQAKGVPLTAHEIADRLHAGEYRDTLRDTLGYKVTHAVHAMKDKGKIILSDARDREGRLTYVLPQRMKFPPSDNRPPANPVLPAEIAAQIKPVEPKPEKKVPAGPPTYAPGIVDDIIKLLDAAPSPMITPEIIRALKHRYPPEFDHARLSVIFGGLIWGLHKERRVLRNAVTGRGRGVKFEYYTKRTGKGTAPVEKPVGGKADWVKPPEPVVEVPPTPTLFRPGAKKVETVQVNLTVPAEVKAKWADAAQRFDIPLVQFMIEAVDYALDHIEGGE